jgi:hypothetical protein
MIAVNFLTILYTHKCLLMSSANTALCVENSLNVSVAPSNTLHSCVGVAHLDIRGPFVPVGLYMVPL